ncbi:MAG: BsuPI-related putative proteinase inhibitor [Gemmatimonas sp.]
MPPSQANLAIAVTVDHDTVAAGAPLRITVTVRNGAPSPRTLSFTSGCATDYELLDAAGTVTATSDQMCAQVITNRTLAASDTLAEVHVLLRGRPGMPVVPPGAYRLRGVLLLAGTPVRSPAIPVQFR